jgi:hypothetical protein
MRRRKVLHPRWVCVIWLNIPKFSNNAKPKPLHIFDVNQLLVIARKRSLYYPALKNMYGPLIHQ